MKRSNIVLAAALAASLFAVPAVFAQQDGPPAGPGAGHGGQRGPGGPGGADRHEDRHEAMGGGPEGRLLPPGTWWRSAEMAKMIGLSPDQQKHMDDLFLQSREHLIDLHAALEKDQLMMEPLLAANPVDQGRAMAQISKIADTRAALEKEDAKMLLSIRGVLTADQWTKLQAMHHHGMGGGDMHGQKGGPRGDGARGQHGPAGSAPMPPASE